jgi:hypothetical protein
LGHYLLKPEEKWPKSPMILTIFVRASFRPQYGRPWLEQWKNSENILRKLTWIFRSEVGSQEKFSCHGLAALIQFNSIFLQFRDFPQLPIDLHKKKFTALKSTHRALAQNPPPHWQPEEEQKKKTDQRSSTKINLREFIHLLSSR